ncbi:MAG: hypothetical protein RBR71_13400 [Gudongella sp.]|nr:hypothetical protein [Gudongella sp.]
MRPRRALLGITCLLSSALIAQVLGVIVGVDDLMGIALSGFVCFVGGCLFTSGVMR